MANQVQQNMSNQWDSHHSQNLRLRSPVAANAMKVNKHENDEEEKNDRLTQKEIYLARRRHSSPATRNKQANATSRGSPYPMHQLENYKKNRNNSVGRERHYGNESGDRTGKVKPGEEGWWAQQIQVGNRSQGSVQVDRGRSRKSKKSNGPLTGGLRVDNSGNAFQSLQDYWQRQQGETSNIGEFDGQEQPNFNGEVQRPSVNLPNTDSVPSHGGHREYHPLSIAPQGPPVQQPSLHQSFNQIRPSAFHTLPTTQQTVRSHPQPSNYYFGCHHVSF